MVKVTVLELPIGISPKLIEVGETVQLAKAEEQNRKIKLKISI